MKLNRKYRKALEALVYLANKDQRNYWILKTIYFADKEHLSRYGSQLFDDSYRAMKLGPVPSLAYDIVKSIRGVGWFKFNQPDPNTALEVPDNKTVIAKRPADMAFLSQSDIECLDFAYNLIKDLSFSKLKKFSHDSAYKAVKEDDEMTIESIISTLENKKEIMDYRNL